LEFLKNNILLWISLLAILAGFGTLKAGMLSVGPILLVVGYCVGLPFYIWRSFQKSVGE